MLTPLVAHGGAAVGPEAIARVWHLDPLLLALLAAGALLCVRQLRRGDTRTPLVLGAALLALAVALVSPLDAASRSLAAAHMIQHVLLVAVAAPLLALALRALWSARLPRPAPLAGFVASVHAVALAGWHGAGPYGAALRHDLVHVAEHASFLGTATLFWLVVAGGLGTAIPHRILLVFAVGMETVFIGVLMTFSPLPWYDEYASTTQAWGLEPLADQQLAGVIMWVPMSLVYVAAALALVGGWLRAADAAR